MIDPFTLICVAGFCLILGAYLGIRHASDAAIITEYKDQRQWWNKAIFLAKQRENYKQFCTMQRKLHAHNKDIEVVEELDHGI